MVCVSHALMNRFKVLRGSRRLLASWLCIGLCGLFVACGREPDFVERTVRVMEEPVTVRLPFRHRDEMDRVVTILEQLHRRYAPLIDVYDAHSEIARANQVGSVSRFPISRDTSRLLHYARQLAANTDGNFDVTDAALRQLWWHHWRQSPDEPMPDAIIRATLRGVGYQHLDVNEFTLLLAKPETQLNVNDFARPFLLDLAMVKLRERGVGHVMIHSADFGRGFGVAKNRQAWSIPLTHPQSDAKLGRLELPAQMAYARVGWPHHFFEFEGTSRSRIINPRTGRPAGGGEAVIVIGPVTADAYALAHACFVLGLEESRSLLARYERFHAIFISREADATIHLSPALEPHFHPEREMARSVQRL